MLGGPAGRCEPGRGARWGWNGGSRRCGVSEEGERTLGLGADECEDWGRLVTGGAESGCGERCRGVQLQLGDNGSRGAAGLGVSGSGSGCRVGADGPTAGAGGGAGAADRRSRTGDGAVPPGVPSAAAAADGAGRGDRRVSVRGGGAGGGGGNAAVAGLRGTPFLQGDAGRGGAAPGCRGTAVTGRKPLRCGLGTAGTPQAPGTGLLLCGALRAPRPPAGPSIPEPRDPRTPGTRSFRTPLPREPWAPPTSPGGPHSPAGQRPGPHISLTSLSRAAAGLQSRPWSTRVRLNKRPVALPSAQRSA